VWRVGDVDLTTDLPELIAEAEGRINRDILDITLEASSVSPALDATQKTPLPATFKQMRAVQFTGSEVSNIDVPPINMQDFPNCFGWVIIGTDLCIGGDPEGIVGGTAAYTYYAKLVPYATDPANPFAEIQPDFFKAAVLRQVFKHIREHESGELAEKEYQTLLESMRDDHYRRMNASEQSRVVGLGGGHF
jgi:hypothetical protein